MESLSQLFYLHGIGYEYTKYTGEQIFFGQDTRCAALRACGIDTADSSQIAHLNIALDAAKWLQLVPSCSIVDAEQPSLKIRIDHRLRDQTCVIEFESINVPTIEVGFNELPCTGDYGFNDITYLEFEVALPKLPIGYHDVSVQVASQQANTELWVTPEQSFQVSDTKRTGLSIQLYSLKNNAGFGVGDFADLLDLVTQAAKLKLDYILLNPLHLLFADEPERASPYSPNNRALLNPLYISVGLCEDSQSNTALISYMNEYKPPESASQYIDYAQVSEFKYTLFDLLFQQFTSSATDERLAQFEHFCAQHQTTLATLKNENYEFACYLQWQAHLQLNQCQQSARKSGMSIGLINDLAVGCASDGTEHMTQQHLFTESAYVGAPPDPWAEQGQNWGLPALNPIKMGDNKFAFYRALIRANMEDVGGLRIDHVMAIRRLWWCFENQGQQDGCYVYYPFEHLLSILTIESHLNECIVIGEDLGVVPPEVKTALADKAIFSNSLFYFEKDQHSEFLPAQAFSRHCLLMIANHDVPPFFGWWQAQDLCLKRDYKLISDEQYSTSYTQRDIEKQRMLRFLEQSGHIGYSLDCNAKEIYTALTISLAHSPAQLFAIQLDDLDEQILPVNIPGTDKEYPNWRRVLNHSSADILTQHAALLNEINLIRTC
ncbi:MULTISPECIES: 4-alpha-glucanotransferase [unclassified Pseudoalteromonas]|uniref:4-alpha-glucanotransferase n=1 Tax=unclassified Pseudoalteromonas TaxID=194690 RepID=UPI0025B3F6DE|nr:MULTISPECIES: 4-alpha-glucanotransferase [unclassified Pseudoalteromonas]MDN3379869.1 4-alpha-glucanotransferase [Pseudoalteromonas sp. APC 3893]MDN3388208.1 4-alpha-glucanotransferase [Pseudoalteromonas sp. APC 4017]